MTDNERALIMVLARHVMSELDTPFPVRQQLRDLVRLVKPEAAEEPLSPEG